MFQLESILLLSFCITFNAAISNYPTTTSFLIPNERRDILGRAGGWGWGDSGLTTFLDKIVSLLTFLSFGVFLLNLLLNALLLGSTLLGFFPTTPTSTGTSVTTTGTGTRTKTTTTPPEGPLLSATGSGGGSGGFGLTMGGVGGLSVGRAREKRSTFESKFDLKMQSTAVSNLMAKELMEMIEAVVSANEQCLPKLLCVTNRRAVVAGNGFQYLMPLCSMGISYFRERFRLQRNVSIYIDAINDGMEELNCSTRHPGCNL